MIIETVSSPAKSDGVLVKIGQVVFGDTFEKGLPVIRDWSLPKWRKNEPKYPKSAIRCMSFDSELLDALAISFVEAAMWGARSASLGR